MNPRLFALFLIAFTQFVICGSVAHAREAAKISTLDAHALPLGDGKVSTAPKRGYVYSCTSSFRGGGAQHTGNWISGSTWDLTKKISVRGDVFWTNAATSINTAGNQRLISSNALPSNHTTGIFPVQRDDPAFQIDHNPNAISAQTITLALPLSPTVAAQSGCLPMGMVGVMLDGVPFFNALDDAGRDAVAHEVQDHCSGHPQHKGEYHYHGPSGCVKAETENNSLIGYALDGFGIYSMYDENGVELTNDDLDACHGWVSRIEWDGKSVEMYHYVLTREYPYTVGCFRGVAVSEPAGRNQAMSGDRTKRADAPRQRHHQPPAQALSACSGLSQNAACSFVSPRGNRVKGTCQSPAGKLACVPQRR